MKERPRINYSGDFRDRGLSTLGDSLANFIFSLALSEFTGKPTGGRVPNASLAIAIERAGLRHLIPPRTDKHGKGDVAEAVIAFAWLEGAFTIEEAVEVLVRNFGDDVLHPYRGKEALGKAFGELLRLIKERLEL
ncbi:ribonuclease III family protein [Thermococcus zilligii]|uniref:ribonuclease III family protein n=1 Tax=Thermococcus zilligii TaxID=54076 RepID=UPI00029B3A62